MTIYLYIIGCCLFIGACLGFLWIGYHLGRDDGYTEGSRDGYNEGRKDAYAECGELMEAAPAEVRRNPKHAASKPRTTLVRDEPRPALALAPVPDPDKTIHWDRGPDAGGVVGISPWYDARFAEIAASRARVVLPEPGSYLPGPRRSTSPNTITFPKVELTTADTGEIRAVGDAMVAAIEAAGGAS